MRPSLLPLIILPLAAACTAGGDAIGRRAAAADPPQLWSIEVVDASARPGDRPIEICADSLIRTGFIAQHAQAGDYPCQVDRAPVITAASASMRCVIGDRQYAIYNAASGDLSRDFQVKFTMRSIGGDDVYLTQTRRYRYLGACPAGWKVGDATDRYGRPAPNAMR